jgi:phage-related protein
LRSTIFFNGKSSADFGLIVEYFPESVHAARRGELIPIPGRNGVIVREDGAFDTYTQQYQVWFRNTMGRDTYQKARDVAEWLLSASGFNRLEDTYEPEFFRLARFVGPLSVETVLRNCGRVTIEFDVQPQRYLKSGETPLTFTGGASATIMNPTQFEARPLLRFSNVSSSPNPEVQTLTMRENYVILPSGKVRDASTINPGYAVSNPVNCSGKEFAQITGNGYAFYDSGGETREDGFTQTGGWSDGATRTNYRISVPSWASTIVVSRAKGRDAQVGLSLVAYRDNPGAAAVNINGVVVNLDFTESDVIYLDCDLHDAYYEGGGNANSMVSFSSSVTAYPTFPGLVPGVNTIIPSDAPNLDFELTPRWWTI